ncbi:SubName: Full=Related to peroxisome assembly protein car1 {ECO:0000313/EMBL:CCA70233.1} [Serendipita indica DSM 11827]|nr:SubName: Full=Related to peroxisome assembly protein car1 {ECO:0000313/EMBL:CCA70233.1} [Serendipita indica DSM 11827]
MAYPAFWQQTWDNAQLQLRSLQASLGALPVLPSHTQRVGQVDAELLDHELLQILKEPLLKAFSLIKSGWELAAEPELSLILQLLLYKYSIWDTGATYGAKLQNLRYKCRRQVPRRTKLAPSGLPARTLWLHGFVTVVLPYIDKRFRSYALSNAWPDAPSFDKRRKIWELALKMESTHATLGLLSFIAFLWNGRLAAKGDRPQSYVRQGPYYRLPETDCAICAEDASIDLSSLAESNSSRSSTYMQTLSGSQHAISYPIHTPCRASCGHVYCYICIGDRLLRAADEGEKYWECLRCEEQVYQATRWEPSERLGRRPARQNDDGNSVESRGVGVAAGRRWDSLVSSSASRLGHGYGTSELDDSELSAMDLDSVSSIGLRTFSGSEDLSE